MSIGIVGGKQLLAPTISYKYSKHQFGVGYNLSNGGLIFKYDYKFKIR